MSQSYIHSYKEISVHFPIKEKHLTDEKENFILFLENGIKRGNSVQSAAVST